MTFQRSTPGEQPSAATASPAPNPAPAPRPTQEPSAQRIGRISYAAAEAAWPSGAAPLARWLRSNPDVLGDLLGTPLQSTADEVPGLEAGVVFLDASGRRTLAVLELGASTEAMLGSLLTRLSSAQATAAVWICGDPRDEHVSAVSWLNHSVDGRFFVARIRAARIDSSEAAPILELVVRPPRAPQGISPPNGTSAERTRRATDHSEVVVDRT